MYQFQMGDRVICVAEADHNPRFIGCHGAIVDVDMSQLTRLQYKVDFGIEQWWCEEEALELESDDNQEYDIDFSYSDLMS